MLLFSSYGEKIQLASRGPYVSFYLPPPIHRSHQPGGFLTDTRETDRTPHPNNNFAFPSIEARALRLLAVCLLSPASLPRVNQYPKLLWRRIANGVIWGKSVGGVSLLNTSNIYFYFCYFILCFFFLKIKHKSKRGQNNKSNTIVFS